MRRARSLEFLNLDPKIERTLRRLRKERRERVPVMSERGNQNQQALKDYFGPVIVDNYSGIRRQAINSNNFELMPALINMVQ